MTDEENADIKVFPAQAGVIPYNHKKPRRKSGIPRASGGDPDTDRFLKHFVTYSPRKRG